MNAKEAISFVEKKHMKKDIPDFKVGDQVKVYQKVIEGEKTRTQIYEGIVIRRKGSGLRENFTVLRQIRGDMVEKIFPIHSPAVEKVVVAAGAKKTRRAKLFYLWQKKEIVS
ncbi:MAG: 50S ribosomal protein L19 [Candidatus Omnitrophica bacterium]|nr:50S ribosomal protein L19 [Candidatus Omnitrophota bacterium]